MKDTFVPGDHNAICFECGRKKKASELVRHWQGYYVCPEHWESRHHQDFVRGVQDKQEAPYIQPQIDSFIAICSLEGQSSVVGYAEVGCSIIGAALAPGFVE